MDEKRMKIVRGSGQASQVCVLTRSSSKVEKFLIFGDLLTGLAQNWHSQLRRTTCCSWKKPLERFIIQYGGYDMPAERQYHYARKRADETPFKYLYCLSVAAIRVKI